MAKSSSTGKTTNVVWGDYQKGESAQLYRSKPNKETTIAIVEFLLSYLNPLEGKPVQWESHDCFCGKLDRYAHYAENAYPNWKLSDTQFLAIVRLYYFRFTDKIFKEAMKRHVKNKLQTQLAA